MLTAYCVLENLTLGRLPADGARQLAPLPSSRNRASGVSSTRQGIGLGSDAASGHRCRQGLFCHLAFVINAKRDFSSQRDFRNESAGAPLWPPWLPHTLFERGRHPRPHTTLGWPRTVAAPSQSDVATCRRRCLTDPIIRAQLPPTAEPHTAGARGHPSSSAATSIQKTIAFTSTIAQTQVAIGRRTGCVPVRPQCRRHGRHSPLCKPRGLSQPFQSAA
jgi:hypothetical protein